MAEEIRQPSSVYDAAKAYQARGWSCIPIQRGTKSPCVKWKEYQFRKPSDEELHKWFATGVNGIAILTGECSNLVVLDIDASHGGWGSAKELALRPEDATVLTGSGGGHYYYSPSRPGLRNFAGRYPGIDFRGEGGYVLAPPTAHPITGKPYVFQSGIKSELPSFLLEATKVDPVRRSVDGVRSAGSIPSSWPDLSPVAQGGRNQAAARIAGRLVSRGVSWERAKGILDLWNSANKPPLPDDEIVAVLKSISETHRRNSGAN